VSDRAASAYAPAFLDHLSHPRGAGTLAAATHRGEAVDRACGDRLALDLRVEGGVVIEARFRVEGCPGAIACGSALTHLLPGRPAVPDAVAPGEVEALLGGIPPSKRHALGLAAAVLRAALQAART
jgi:nitrogen fixation NifU-like protein